MDAPFDVPCSICGVPRAAGRPCVTCRVPAAADPDADLSQAWYHRGARAVVRGWYRGLDWLERTFPEMRYRGGP